MGDPLEEEEATVEVEDEPQYESTEDTAKQFQPSYLDYIYYSVLHYFSNPWAFLILVFIFYKLFWRLKAITWDPLRDRFDEWNAQRAEEAEAARLKKNPDEYRSRMEAMEVARARMQEAYDSKATEWMQKKLEQEEKRREQDIKDWEMHQEGKGYKSRAPRGTDSAREALEKQAALKGKKGFKPERNPLMDFGGGGSSYRPARRGFSSGGG